MAVTDARKALHYSTGKSGVDQIPPQLLVEWGDVFAYGADKYERDNWKKGNDWHEFYGSALRHLLAWWNGQDIDPESGLHHLAHAMWNVGALRFYQIANLGVDDRANTKAYFPEKDTVSLTIERPNIPYGEAAVLDGRGDIAATLPVDPANIDYDIRVPEDYPTVAAALSAASQEGVPRRILVAQNHTEGV